VSVTAAQRARDAGARARALAATWAVRDGGLGAEAGGEGTAAEASAGPAGWTSAPAPPPIDEARCRAVLAELAEAGLLKHVAPASFGGAAETVEVSSLAAIREELAYGSGLHDLLFVMQGLGSFPITYAGDEAQRRLWLPRVVSGEAIAAFAVTEPGAGSDVGAIATRARREGDGYVLDGTKIFISNAPFADMFTVIAQTDPSTTSGRGPSTGSGRGPSTGSGRGRKGLAAFVVARGTPGLTVRADIELIAPHPIGTVLFEGCRVPASSRLGAEGDGFKIAMANLDRFRATVGAAAVGFARRALDEALRFARKRVQFGRPIGDYEGIQFKLAEMATKLDAARLLVQRAACSADRGAGAAPAGYPISPLGEDASREASMAKLFATEAAQEIVDEAVQIHGGRGLVRGAVVEHLYREVRALRIYEGTSEIQRTVIARSLLA